MLPYPEQKWGFHAMDVNFAYCSMPGTRIFQSLTKKTVAI